ncbi:MAG: tetratricopeptide repeat protein [Bradymonadales bacterium]|nr:tetratricopeptide repeat protein [Bradymonadales bacterium]
MQRGNRQQRSERGPYWALLAVFLITCGGGEAHRRVGSEIEIQPADRSAQSAAVSDSAGETEGPGPGVRPISPEEARIAIEEAARALDAGNLEQARRWLEPMLDHPEYAAVAEYNLGVLSQLAGQGFEADRHYQRALDAEETLAPALTALLRLRLSQGDVDGAELAFQRALRTSGNALGIQAIGLFLPLHRGEYERTIQLAREILLAQEGNIDAHLALALAYHHLHQSELARFVLDTALEREPERVDLWLAVAMIQMEEGNHAAAITSYRRVLDLDRRSVEAHNNLGVLLHRARNEEEAVEHLRRAIALKPDFLEAYLNLSNSLKAMGDLEGAERAIREALRIDPAFWKAYFNLGLLYLDTDFPRMSVIERLEAAVEAFTRYRTGMGPALAQDDRVEEYIDEALARIDAERQLARFGPAGASDEEFEEEQIEPEELEDLTGDQTDQPLEEEWEQY